MSLLEQLRAALLPEYYVEREIASGGMGVVYLARDVALACPVAVKILRPELATAAAAERFVREAQTAAKLRHPNIVIVHSAGERRGFYFYVMDYIEDPTLAQRLERGPLPPARVVKLGRDLLDALEHAHTRHVVHRDIKPSNVFIAKDRALLGDFGIAKAVDAASARDAPGLTGPRGVVGTAGYMPPEQAAGGEVTPRTDLHAAGMVLYEALTRRRWPVFQPETANWAGVPRRIARVLRRALEFDPERRWPDAGEFRRALWRTRVWPYRRNTIGVAIGCTVLGIAIGLGLLRAGPPATAFQIGVQVASAPPGLPPWLPDSVACGLARRLDGYPDLSVRCASGLARLWERGRHVRPEIENVAGGLRVRLTSTVEELDAIEVQGQVQQWRVLVDTLADRVFGSLLGSRGLLDRSLPAAVLPKTRAGLLAFQKAERLFADARWGEARSAYAAAAALDTACWLCYLRHAEVGRWLDLEDDPADNIHDLAHVDAFPLHYQRLIRAQQLPVAARLDSLDALTRRWKDFLFGQFRRGDELLHRGPLVGRSRREALAPFEEVLKFQPAFGPALEHVAWVHVAEGDSAGAAAALTQRERLGSPSDPRSFATLALVELAYAWRFLPPADAERRTDALIRLARAAGVVQLDAGARYLPAFGVPHGALAFAERLLHEPGFERSASIARVLALVGLGRPDTAVALARRLAGRFPDLAIFADELSAAMLVFDSDSARFAVELPAVRARLNGDVDQPGPADRRRRAVWMLAVLERAPSAADDPVRGRPLAGEPAPRALTVLLQAEALAARGAYASALAATDRVTGIPVAQTEDPFFRTVLHLSRAAWYERAGRPASAQADLIWHENSDVFRYPTGDPQAAELDWAFAPLAEWRLALLLERSGGSPADACRAYRTVARLWADGEPRYRARAVTATQRLVALQCAVL